MGAGAYFDSDKFFHEVDGTRSAHKTAMFNGIIERMEANGAVVDTDDEFPYYKELSDGTEEEVGTERVIEFEMGDFDYKLTQTVENYRVAGRKLEPFDPPQVNITLMRKEFNSQNWESVDLSKLIS